MKNNQKPWKIIESTDVSPSKWFPIKKDLIELPNGKQIEYFKSELENVAMILPITENNEIIFVEQYKHGIGEVTLELPAGRIDKGKDPSEVAIEELREETGIEHEQKDLVFLTELWTEPSKSSVRVFGYLAKAVQITSTQNLEETENIKIRKIPMSKVAELIERGEIHASDTLALIGLATLKGLI